ncbi:MAG TPA: LptF/LptG family permease [Ferruginibacter sp.]|jgi:lipopolysaccharide export system permease protein|nr:LptF/LptG family permease [Ferruginibacter sp.]
MKKIDRYILKSYLSTFFFCILLITALVVVIDISEHADDFALSKLSSWQIFTQFYLGFIPRIDALLFPLFAFISVIFFTAKMAERSEVIAILSSGVSFKRYLYPYWVGGFFLAALLWFGYRYVVPRANEKWGNFTTKYIDSNVGDFDNSTVKENTYFRIDSTSYAGIRYYNSANKSGDNFFVQKIINNKLVYDLRAQTINWDTTAKKWQLYNVAERFLLGGDKFTIKRSSSKLEEYSFKPLDLKKDDYLKDRMSTPELNEYIRMEQLRGSEQIGTLLVERYNRDAIPFSVIVLTIIGVSLSSRKVRGGSGFQLALGLIISSLYVLCSRLSIVFAMKGNFPPILAAWTPNIIFAGVAFYIYKKAPK